MSDEKVSLQQAHLEAAAEAAVSVLSAALGEEFGYVMVVVGPNYKDPTDSGHPSTAQMMVTSAEGAPLMKILTRTLEMVLPRALAEDPEGMRDQIREMLVERMRHGPTPPATPNLGVH